MKTCYYIRIADISCTGSDDAPFHLQYYLTFQKQRAVPHTLYGICVRKFTETCESFEEASTPPISCSESFVRDLIEKLIRNTITPLCLLEVLDDLLCFC